MKLFKISIHALAAAAVMCMVSACADDPETPGGEDEKTDDTEGYRGQGNYRSKRL